LSYKMGFIACFLSLSSWGSLFFGVILVLLG
jgi:hypothetical protein